MRAKPRPGSVSLPAPSELARPAWRRWPRWPRWPWYQWLFLGFALLYVMPFWVVHFVPTMDGPCHLYNAWALRHYGDSAHYPLLSRYYEVDARPFPNWLTHLLLAGLMWSVPPVVSEKLLASGYVLLLMGGLWYLAGAVEIERRWLAFLGFLFVFNLPWQCGFYNFCYSLGLFVIAVGYWWRRRDRFDLGVAVKLNLLLWLCYFAHIVSSILALLAIAVLWLATLRRTNFKRRLVQIGALAPQAALPLWFVLVQGGSPSPAHIAFAGLWHDFVHFSVFFGLKDQTRFGVVLEVVFVLLIALSIGCRLRAWRRREAGAAGDLGFLVLAAACAVLFFVAPEGMSGGLLLPMRLAAYPWLILIPWLAPGLRGHAKAAAVGVLALLAGLNLCYVVRCYRQLDSVMVRFTRGLDAVENNTVVVPLLFNRYDGGCSQVGYLDHAIDHAAIAKGLVDWDNYEAVGAPREHHFPLRFKDSASHETNTIEATPENAEPRELKEQVDYVYCWKMPPGQRIGRRLRHNFALVGDSGDSQLFRSPRLRP
jgi:hypothetical protein